MICLPPIDLNTDYEIFCTSYDSKTRLWEVTFDRYLDDIGLRAECKLKLSPKKYAEFVSIIKANPIQRIVIQQTF